MSRKRQQVIASGSQDKRDPISSAPDTPEKLRRKGEALLKEYHQSIKKNSAA